MARILTYTVSDGMAQATATVTIHVTNQAPVGVDDYYTVTPGVLLTVPATEGVLAGESTEEENELKDFDPDGDPLTAILVCGPQYAASFQFNTSDGSFTYQANGSLASAGGIDTFTYKAFDGNQSSTPVTVHLNLAPVVEVTPVQGAGAVPGNSIYDYYVRFPATDPNNITTGTWSLSVLNDDGSVNANANVADAAVITASGTLRRGNNISGRWVSVQFKNQPNSVRISLNGLTIGGQAVNPTPKDVDVVQVTVTTPANAFTPGQAFQENAALATIVGNVDNRLIINGNKTHAVIKRVWAANINNPTAGLIWKAQVTLTGPGPNQDKGVASIQVGFVQYVQTTAASVKFVQSGRTFTSSLVDGNYYFDSSDPNGQWQNPNAVLTGQSGPIESNDTPDVPFPVKFVLPNNVLLADPGPVSFRVDFKLDVAAITTAADVQLWQGARNPTWAQAKAVQGQNDESWSFVATGTIGAETPANLATSYLWTGGAGAGVTPPTSWQAVDAPREEDRSGKTAQELLPTEDWRG